MDVRVTQEGPSQDLVSLLSPEGGDLRGLVSPPDRGTPSTLSTMTIDREPYIRAAHWSLTPAHSVPLRIRLTLASSVLCAESDQLRILIVLELNDPSQT